MSNSTVLSTLTKAAGFVGLGLIAIDSHNAGSIKGAAYEKSCKAQELNERHLRNMELNSPSVVQSAVKKRILQFQMDENITGFFNTLKGYFGGFSSMLVDHIVPLGLSIGTFIGKGPFSKLCGLGLLAYGGIFLLQEIFGIGKAKE